MRSLVCLGFISLLCSFCGCGSVASEANTTAKKSEESYQHHRILIWTIDRETHAIIGFEDATIGPSQEITLKPVLNYAVSIRTGAIENATVTDFKTEWQEKRVPFRFACGSGSAEGTKDIENLFLHFEYNTSKKLKNFDSILIGIPVGPSSTKIYLDEIDRIGAADALEDVILMAATQRESPLYLDDLLHTYRWLRTSHRLDRWKESLNSGTPNQRLDSSGVLMQLGDVEGRRVFCKYCLTTKGNLQVDLVDRLVDMPPSDEALATMVKLLVAPRVYLTVLPNGDGVAAIERRYTLIQALSKDYSHESLKPYSAELRQWAKSDMGQKYDGESVLELLDEK